MDELGKSFNGAAALTLRKPESRRHPPGTRLCFNGAAALTLRKHGRYIHAHGRPSGFNGAAALTLRKLARLLTPWRQFVQLQWGRSVNAAETRIDSPLTPANSPLQWGRSVNAAETQPNVAAQREANRFNGAAALTLRKRVGDGRLQQDLRLQWGRSVNAAETKINGLRAHGAVKLQWGRSVNAAETMGGGRHGAMHRGASMGPQR